MAIAKRKKKFFEVKIPIIGKETQMQAYEIEELNGRFLKYDLTRLLKGKSVMITLKVTVDKNEATSSPKKIEVMPYFIRRMVRKGTNYVEDSFDAESKDAKLRIKPFLITRRKVSRAVRKALREETKKELLEYIKEKNTLELFDEILKNQLQKRLSLKLKKIYPLALCEIRVIDSKKKE
jgi:ribosomal protein S3AE